MHQILRKFLRSSHIVEVFTSYGIVFLLMQYICLFKLNYSFSRLILLTTLGLIFYSLLEYIFHRIILHCILHKAHQNHHQKPRDLRIIGTPILPVQMYGFLFTSLLMGYFGKENAWAINSGVVLGQCIMDSVHIIFHSKWRPKFLESARSYHMHHHFIDGNFAHGLTTPFWDFLFGTYPKDWRYIEHVPLLYYFQFPIPLFSFILFSYFAGEFRNGINNNNTNNNTNNTTNNTNNTTTTTGSNPLNNNNEFNVNNNIDNKSGDEIDHQQFLQPRIQYVIESFCTATILVLIWPI